eukprot:TRINITY_DN1184_c0_g1_i1.p1 TRINITY_DN1184_c0_g1~~TRINITY_DN1184_c0_g1_i1.p1  ORF type:complete len:1402 (+),score=347.33 TRINITY_DN1184_c0_g1_i1:26-4231(+)
MEIHRGGWIETNPATKSPARSSAPDSTHSEASAVCFHPNEPIMCLAVDGSVYVYNMANSSLIVKYRVTKASKLKNVGIDNPIKYIGFLPNNMLVACQNDGELTVRQIQTHELHAQFKQPVAREHTGVPGGPGGPGGTVGGATKEQMQSLPPELLLSLGTATQKKKLPVVCFATSHLEPFVFYSKQIPNAIIVFDLSPAGLQKKKQHTKIDTVKSTSAIVCHPTRHWMVSAYVDGKVLVWDYKTKNLLFTCDEHMRSNEKAPLTPPIFLSFDPRGEYLIMLASNGILACWREKGGSLRQEGSTPLALYGLGKIPVSNIVAMSWHPFHQSFFTINNEGTFLSWKLSNDPESCVQTGLFKMVNVIEMEMNSRYGVKDINDRSNVPMLKVQGMYFHQKLNYTTFTFTRQLRGCEGVSAYTASPLRHGTYNFREATSEGSLSTPRMESNTSGCSSFSLPVVSPLVCPSSTFFSQSDASQFEYPKEIFFLQNNKALVYSVTQNKIADWEYSLPEKDDSGAREFFSWKIQASRSNGDETKLLVFNYSIASHFQTISCDFYYSMITASSPTEISTLLSPFSNNEVKIDQLTPGRDGCFIGENDENYLILSQGRKKLNLYSTDNQKPIATVQLSSSFDRIYPSPAGFSRAVIYHNLISNQLVYSANYKAEKENTSPTQETAALDYQPSSMCFQLNPDEALLQLSVQRSADRENQFVAVVTSDRVLMLSANLSKIINSTQSVPDMSRNAHSQFPRLQSCAWADDCLFFVSESHVYFMTARTILPVLNIPDPAIISGIMNDRLILATTRGGLVTFRWRSVGLLMPLAFAKLDLPSNPTLEEDLAVYMSRFDRLRIDGRLLDRLGEREGLSSAAFALVANSTYFHWVVRYHFAADSHNLGHAYEILSSTLQTLKKSMNIEVSDESRVKREKARLALCRREEAMVLFASIKSLALQAQNEGKFDLAQKCYSMLDDKLNELQTELLTGSDKVSFGEFSFETVRGATRESVPSARRPSQFSRYHETGSDQDEIEREKNFSVIKHSFSLSARYTHDQIKELVTNAPKFHSLDSEAQEKEPKHINDLDTPDKVWKTTLVPNTLMVEKGGQKRLQDNLKKVSDNLDIIDPIGMLNKIERWALRPQLGDQTGNQAPEKITRSITPMRGNTEAEPQSSADKVMFPPKELLCGSSILGLTACSSSSKREEVLRSTYIDDEDIPASSAPSVKQIALSPKPTTVSATKTSSHSLRALATSNNAMGNRLIPENILIRAPSDSSERAVSLGRKYKTLAIHKLEGGLFPQALNAIEMAVLHFVSEKNNSKNRSEIRECVAYKTALRLLVEIKYLEKSGNKERLAFLAHLLAETCISPKHRVTCLRYASQRNFDAQNYGLAAKFLKALIVRGLNDKIELQAKLQLCKS